MKKNWINRYIVTKDEKGEFTIFPALEEWRNTQPPLTWYEKSLLQASVVNILVAKALGSPGFMKNIQNMNYFVAEELKNPEAYFVLSGTVLATVLAINGIITLNKQR